MTRAGDPGRYRRLRPSRLRLVRLADPARRGFPAPYALPVAFAALFAIGTVAAGLHGRLPATGVMIASAIVVGTTAIASETLACLPLGVIGWLTVIGFSPPPYAQLLPTRPVAQHAAIVLAATAIGAGLAGLGLRHWSA